MPLSNMAHRDIETVIHPYTNLARHREVGPLILNEGRGIFLYDETGKRYIEGMAGLWCTTLGFGEKRLAEAAKRQIEELSFYHLFGGKAHPAAIRLAEKYPCFVATVGVHPHHAALATGETWKRMEELLRHPLVPICGEIGLDYHYNFSPPEVQRDHRP